MKALLVDDQKMVRESLAMAMHTVDSSVEITSCSTIAAARELMSATEFDFLFLDIELKGARRAGLEFLQELKEAGNQVRVVMVSSEDSKQTVLEAIGSGAVGFLSKNESGLSAYRDAVDVVLKNGTYLPNLDWSGAKTPPPSQLGAEEPVVITTVSQDALNVTPRQYEALYHLSKGNQYKTIAKIMDIEPRSVEESMRSAFGRMNVENQLQFMVMLNQNGWRLEL